MAKSLPKSEFKEEQLILLSEAIKEFKNELGDFGKTKRATFIGAIKNRDKLIGNIKSTLSEGIRDKILGLDKAKSKDDTLIKNKLFTQILTGQRFAERPIKKDNKEPYDNMPLERLINAPQRDELPIRKDTPIKDEICKEDSSILSLIESNTKGMLLLFENYNEPVKLQNEFLENISESSNSTLSVMKDFTKQEIANDKESFKRDRERLKESQNNKSIMKDGISGNISAGAVTSSVLGGGLIGEIAGEVVGQSIFSFLGKKGGLLKALAPKTMLKGVGKVGAKLGARSIPLVGSILGMGLDAMSGSSMAKEFGTSKTGGIMGAVLAGSDKGFMGAFMNISKWAAAGAGIGSFVPVVGTIAGGLIGAAIGGLFSWIGAEKIANYTDKVSEFASGLIGGFFDKLKMFFSWDNNKGVFENIFEKFNIIQDVFMFVPKLLVSAITLSTSTLFEKLTGIDISDSINNMGNNIGEFVSELFSFDMWFGSNGIIKKATFDLPKQIASVLGKSLIDFGKNITDWIKGIFVEDDETKKRKKAIGLTIRNAELLEKNKIEVVKNLENVGIDKSDLSEFIVSGQTDKLDKKLKELLSDDTLSKRQRNRLTSAISGLSEYKNKTSLLFDNELTEIKTPVLKDNTMTNLDLDERFNLTKDLEIAKKEQFEKERASINQNLIDASSRNIQQNNNSATIIANQPNPYNVEQSILLGRASLMGIF